MSRRLIIIVGLVVAVILGTVMFFTISTTPSWPPNLVTSTATSYVGIVVSSPAFRDGERIPSKYTCDGRDVSPPLTWGNAPSGTVSYVLILEDPDAPSVFTHWLIFNVPASESSLQENIPRVGVLGDGAMQGRNNFGALGYGGPCPPQGTHRYQFHVYAIDSQLRLSAGASKEDILKAVQGHILGVGVFTGLYGRG